MFRARGGGGGGGERPRSIAHYNFRARGTSARGWMAETEMTPARYKWRDYLPGSRRSVSDILMAPRWTEIRFGRRFFLNADENGLLVRRQRDSAIQLQSRAR